MAQDYTSREANLSDIMATGCGVIHRYWDDIRNGRFAPPWGTFRLIDLPPEIIPYIRVVDVIDGGRDFHYRFWGTGLSTVRSFDRTGMKLSEIDSPRTQTALAEFIRVIREKRCLALVYNARSGENRASLHAPSIRLPLSSDGETVDRIVCYTDFKTDNAEWRRFFEERSKAKDTK